MLQTEIDLSITEAEIYCIDPGDTQSNKFYCIDEGIIFYI